MTKSELLTPNQIVKSKRKTISLVIKNNGDFIIRAPLNAKNKDIDKFIHQKENWIIKKRTEQFSNAVMPLTFNGEEQISILGKVYNLIYDDVFRAKIVNDQILLPSKNPKDNLVLLLKKIAKNHLRERVDFFSNKFDLSYASVSISNAKTCWGSCSFSNKLHFTYKLIMCPEEIVDYIVIHELCHTKIKNHSAKFWELVMNYNPCYKTHEQWLKKNRAIINII